MAAATLVRPVVAPALVVDDVSARQLGEGAVGALPAKAGGVTSLPSAAADIDHGGQHVGEVIEAWTAGHVGESR